MPVEEFLLWRAYDRESPIGDMRQDVMGAIIAAAPLQAAGAKVSAADMLPPWSRLSAEQEAAGAEPEEDAAETFFAFLRGRAAVTASAEVE
ncbi:phage tail assembly protein T [Stutzerimonas degradans]|uniref:phage tail assembly protein T n=1 Tax=Stutzerimonas degradans TaxID=2968968 RepID=UPI001C49C177|nr:DUF4035 domain-containing protein [Stutzerimonas degradans]